MSIGASPLTRADAKSGTGLSLAPTGPHGTLQKVSEGTLGLRQLEVSDFRVGVGK